MSVASIVVWRDIDPGAAAGADPASSFGLRRDKSGFRLRPSDYAVTSPASGFVLRTSP